MCIETHKIIIVGKGSRLFRKLNLSAQKPMKELSTSQARDQGKSFDENCLLIIFSLLDQNELRSFLSEVNCKSVTIGSVSALSKIAHRFKYSALKKRQLDAILSLNDPRHKIILFGDFSNLFFIGDYYQSSLENFWSAIDNALKSEEICSLNAKLIKNSDSVSEYLSIIDLIAAPLSSVILKSFTKRVYGYTDGKNYHDT